MYIVKTKRCLIWKLQREIKRGRLLNVDNVARGIGKTTLLVKMARETGAVIVCRDLIDANRCGRAYPDVTFISASDNKLYIGNRKRLLLEEGIAPKLEKVLRIANRELIIGGYTGIGTCKYHIVRGEKYELDTK